MNFSTHQKYPDRKIQKNKQTNTILTKKGNFWRNLQLQQDSLEEPRTPIACICSFLYFMYIKQSKEKNVSENLAIQRTQEGEMSETERESKE